jgi:hypothetical protein
LDLLQSFVAKLNSLFFSTQILHTSSGVKEKTICRRREKEEVSSLPQLDAKLKISSPLTNCSSHRNCACKMEESEWGGGTTVRRDSVDTQPQLSFEHSLILLHPYAPLIDKLFNVERAPEGGEATGAVE